ncbi:MAG: LysM peptidoglycan-binding domain-containing protein [Loktanella sp.]|nr:LysM peptidoglycan-binding domain-containing protein [Loktanella sp.]
MVKSVIAFFVVAACVCVMIIIQPAQAPERYLPISDETVSRNQTLLTPETQGPTSPADAATVSDPADAEDPAPVVEPLIARPSTDRALLDTTQRILTELAPTRAEIEMRTGRRQLEKMVTQALQDGRSEAEIERMLDLAISDGDIAVPPALATPGGGVDAEALIRSIAGPPEAAVAQAAAPRTYVVQPGDTLRIIAEAFYGDRDASPRIAAANTDTLPDPDLIEIGMELVIP